MAERILITTHHLESAVPLRDAFEARKMSVELLTPSEDIADIDDPALLILTGGLDGKRARRLAAEAAQRNRLPVMGIAGSPEDVPPSLRARLGLMETFIRPIDPEEVVLAGTRLIERRRLRELTGIVGETDAMLEVLERTTQMAPVKSNVLITGESGTGKELVARGIHALSPRRHKPFIAANVAALAETLLESELFGHEKGAFTGAVAQRKGLFELADKGTLFLDEIGEMPLTTQTKLLRVLEQREFRRVGGQAPIRVDVRLVAATNRDLRDQVELGDFRRDLYYRLNVLHIDLPPLRERREDIPLLVDEFIRVTGEEHDLSGVEITPEAMALLMDHDWPGNIRELRNLVESVVVMMSGRTITPADIPPSIKSKDKGLSPNLPAPVMPPARDDDGDSDSRPALEFIFRMLLQLRVDVEELKSGFDEYRREHPEPPPLTLPYPYREGVAGRDVSSGVPPMPTPAHPPYPHTDAEEDDDEDEALDEERVVLYRPGMSMEEVEKETITAALKEVGGNRREAAEKLGIGERTLYRKIKQYEIPL